MFAHAKGPRAPLLLLAGVVLVFLKPLGELVQLARADDMVSHVLLIPFISYYLLSVGRRKDSQGKTTAPVADKPGGERAFAGRRIGLPLLALGLALYGANLVLIPGPAGDRLSWAILAFVMCAAGAHFSFLDRAGIARGIFPCAFLIFMVPMPEFMRNGLEIFFQHSSAEAANMLLALTGTPMLRDGLIFQIPGITIQVARECSGIHSSYVLFMTSLVAGHLFLRGPWKRFILVAFVIPLGILRNGFRICIIAMLCVHIGPEMIHSPIHLRGGPIFFVLSLIPFFALLLWLYHLEQKKRVERPASALTGD
jgi:exosortase C (VPDSG-CTERM-specific)